MHVKSLVTTSSTVKTPAVGLVSRARLHLAELTVIRDYWISFLELLRDSQKWLYGPKRRRSLFSHRHVVTKTVYVGVIASHLTSDERVYRHESTNICTCDGSVINVVS